MMPIDGWRAELGMYPFASVRWAWDELWGAVAARVPWAPPKLDHSGDVHAAWDDPGVIVNHVCGAPFVLRHLDTMTLVGAFDLSLPNEPDVGVGRYRSVLVTPHPDRDLVSLVSARLVVNSVDSLSGALSLAEALQQVAPPGSSPVSVTETGAHAESISALLGGEADLACVDAWSLALLRREDPDAVARLHRVGFGPVIPTPAITVRNPEHAPELADAFADALVDTSTSAAREALYLSGWIAPALDEYFEVARIQTIHAHVGEEG